MSKLTPRKLDPLPEANPLDEVDPFEGTKLDAAPYIDEIFSCGSSSKNTRPPAMSESTPTREEAKRGLSIIQDALNAPVSTERDDVMKLAGEIFSYGFAGVNDAGTNTLCSNTLVALLQRAEKAETDLALARKKWEGVDVDDEWTEAIDAAHPVSNRDNAEAYGTALKMVGSRHSKYALVHLVTWLLSRAEKAEALVKKGRNLIAASRAINKHADTKQGGSGTATAWAEEGYEADLNDWDRRAAALTQGEK